jgi:hypothetical protein
MNWKAFSFLGVWLEGMIGGFTTGGLFGEWFFLAASFVRLLW